MSKKKDIVKGLVKKHCGKGGPGLNFGGGTGAGAFPYPMPKRTSREPIQGGMDVVPMHMKLNSGRDKTPGQSPSKSSNPRRPMLPKIPLGDSGGLPPKN